MDNKDFRKKHCKYAFNYDEYIKSVINKLCQTSLTVPCHKPCFSDTTIPRPGYDAAKASQFLGSLQQERRWPFKMVIS